MTKALTGRGEVEARVGQILPDYAQRLEPLSLVLPAMCLGREERRSVLIRALKNRPLFFFFFCMLGRLCCGCNFAFLIRRKGKATLSMLSTPDYLVTLLEQAGV